MSLLDIRFVLIVIYVGYLSVVETGSNDACFMSKSGHQCCDRKLESAITDVMIKSKNLLATASAIQKGAEKKLGGKFEAVVALDDFAYRNHFHDGLTCKVEVGGKYAIAWQPKP